MTPEKERDVHGHRLVKAFVYINPTLRAHVAGWENMLCHTLTNPLDEHLLSDDNVTPTFVAIATNGLNWVEINQIWHHNL
jgi:hypothetical protein